MFLKLRPQILNSFLFKSSRFTNSLCKLTTVTDDPQITVQYQIVEPTFPISYPNRVFPSDIQKPNYANTGSPSRHNNQVTVKCISDIYKISNSCKIAKNILMSTGEQVKPGMTCEDIDDIVYQLCLKHKCYPSPLNYCGFPKCVTTCINNIAVHAIPDQRPLLEGDIISIDVSIFHDGFHGDCCHTFTVGECDPQAKHLINVAELCLYEAINKCKAGEKISIIGKTIQEVAEEYNMGVIKEFCGHGVGKDLHENPQILHYINDSKEIMEENSVFTIEPIINETPSTKIVQFDDGWTITTEEYTRTAQFEHTIWVQKDRAVILTSLD